MNILLFFVHVTMAVLASWRITELFTQDRITFKLRTKFPTYLWQCPRCMSVWAGVWVVILFALAPFTHNLTPWLNWPFALAWLYLVQLDWAVNHRVSREGRKFEVAIKGQQWTVTKNEMTQDEFRSMVQTLMAPPPIAPSQPPPPPLVNGAARN